MSGGTLKPSWSTTLYPSTQCAVSQLVSQDRCFQEAQALGLLSVQARPKLVMSQQNFKKLWTVTVPSCLPRNSSSTEFYLNL